MLRREAEDRFHRAVRTFAKSWTDFEVESSDTSPEDACYVAADGFFIEYPQWQEWAKAMVVPEYDKRPKSRTDVKEIVADYVYDAMTSKRPKKAR